MNTLIAEVVGIIAIVASGMPAGREGPMVQAGACLANVVTLAASRIIDWFVDHPRRSSTFLTNDFDRRNFVSMGAAAGVAAAFHAPIGGILFSLEEVSTFWDPQLTLLTFVMVAVAACTVALWSAGIYGQFDDFSLVLQPSGADAAHGSGFATWELPIFVGMAIVCGLLGAAFNEANRRVTILRRSLVGPRPVLRMVEAIFSVWLVLSFLYALPFAYPCRTLDNSTSLFDKLDAHTVDTAHGINLVEWQCGPNTSGLVGSGQSATGGGHGRRLAGGVSSLSMLPSDFNDMATLGSCSHRRRWSSSSTLGKPLAW